MGTLEIQLRDVMTGYGVSGTVRLAPMQVPPEAAAFKSYPTDDNGKLILRLPAGNYLDEEVAPGYEIVKGHTGVGPGVVSRGQIMMQPEQMPRNLQGNVTKDTLNRNPGTAMIHGYVVDSVTFRPVSGVHLQMERLGASATSDEHGYYQLIFPFRPTPLDQARPENNNRETDTIVTSAQGYRTLKEDGVELDAGASTQNIELDRGTGEVDVPHLERGHGTEVKGPLPESSAQPLRKELMQWMGSKGKTLPAEKITASATANLAAATPITLPTSVTVGCGSGGCSMKNNPNWKCSSFSGCATFQRFPLETYVQDGLDQEWDSTWMADSLKAGSVAYRTYGAWRVANPLCPSVGYQGTNYPTPCTVVYDLCNTESCQVFEPATAPSTVAAAQATAGVILTSDGVHAFKAEYAQEPNGWACSDGQTGEPASNWPCMLDPISQGAPTPVDSKGNIIPQHGRGMSQRGSQRWAAGMSYRGVATDPRDWRCILDHYYNANSNSITADPTGIGVPGAGSGLRTAYMQGQPTYGYVAYEAYGSGRGTGIRAARTADGSYDYLIVSSGSYPSWEPGGNRLAYTLSGTGIFVVNASGSNPREIVPDSCGPGNECDFAPAWSPIEDKIAFCSYRGGSWHIWTINPDDGSQPQMISTPISVQDASYQDESCYLRWSPDGKMIAFTGLTASIPYASRYDVYSLHADGSDSIPFQLTACQINGGGNVSVCSTPSWSPDGTKIAFSDENTFYGDNIGGAGLYTMNPSGSGITPIYQNLKADEMFPQWTSDGKQFVFTGEYSFGAQSYDIFTLNIDGSNPDPIVQANKSYYPYAIDCSHCGDFGKL